MDPRIRALLPGENAWCLVIPAEAGISKWIKLDECSAGGIRAGSAFRDRAQVHPCSCCSDHHPWWIEAPENRFQRESRLLTIEALDRKESEELTLLPLHAHRRH